MDVAVLLGVWRVPLLRVGAHVFYLNMICLGFYQRGDSNNPLSIETSFLSLSHYQQSCDTTFPHGLSPSPRVENINKYGGWNMTPSNVLFTNGECAFSVIFRTTRSRRIVLSPVDPWRTMGLASIESNAPMRHPSAAVPACVTHVLLDQQLRCLY